LIDERLSLLKKANRLDKRGKDEMEKMRRKKQMVKKARGIAVHRTKTEKGNQAWPTGWLKRKEKEAEKRSAKVN